MSIILETKALLRAGVRAAARFLPADALVAPCYHLVTDGAPPHVRHLYRWRGEREFRRDLDYLLKNFELMPLGGLGAAIAAGGTLPKRAAFLSFDDGFREMSEIVAPVCLEKGVPATFFLTSGFLDNRMLGYRHKASLLTDAWPKASPAVREAVVARLGARDRMFLDVRYGERRLLDECAALMDVDFEEYLRFEKPYLTGDQVARLIRDGFAIGGHSVDHPLYADLALEEQLEQTRGCLEDLARRAVLPVRAFAFPFVSDGVGDAFFTQVLGGKMADLVFCIGRMPAAHGGRAIQRFGVESMETHSIEELVKRDTAGRWVERMARWRVRFA